jgi:hypothetical protein
VREEMDSIVIISASITLEALKTKIEQREHISCCGVADVVISKIGMIVIM